MRNRFRPYSCTKKLWKRSKCPTPKKADTAEEKEREREREPIKEKIKSNRETHALREKERV